MLDDLTDWFDEEKGGDPVEPVGPDASDFDFEADLPDLAADADLSFTDPAAVRDVGINIETEEMPDLSVEFGQEAGAAAQPELSFGQVGGTPVADTARPPTPPWMADVGTADPRGAAGVAQASPSGEYPRLSTRRGALREGPGIG